MDQDQNRSGGTMIAVIQRTLEASVTVDGIAVGSIGHGLLILLGVARGDGADEVKYLAGKVAHLRIFDNESGKFDHSLLDTGGEALVVSQFTLLGSWRKGRRPGYENAAPPDEAEALVRLFVDELVSIGVKKVETGKFGAHMRVRLVNDGPVTFTMNTNLCSRWDL